ncbi:tRNA (adenosine(37)-N6)-threonylcarbamoyltransferase complex dimerization subunit type 1 TsaB [Lyngbya sp. CCY1209]|uniref:tRNA (adenosine(37)-N6)-threonylcarbamoyltransferase complex dimerization subunit type 1 TsaB n=1 Tax=Lyngbya sp. CCY1209 TaxID=2886103 RepID=UPI002D20C98D|nr:tRNA (adenosine(37)-N6)-threonylcarbamoyltransferase complex dimerization subunit type 1 TsaB [Lyngbya sp. CCY1209]MEB3884647.1 tRNA (adenosine(37)-N6)-threonylcarbamoyltransferase complex dimerization subunit type 1 TsaB [Lyngbya sp. CCY1209]
MKKYGLALHTSSPELGLAIANFKEKPRSQTWNLGRELSTQLHQHLTEFLPPQTWPDLKFIAVARGPGSFTGTRMGVVTARTLAQQLDIPLFSISTLAAAAWNYAKPSETAIALQMRAQRGQLFTAIYNISETGITAQLADRVMSPEDWEMILKQKKIPRQITLEGGLGETTVAMLELANWLWNRGERPHWSEAVPFYGQHPVEEKTP